MRNDPQPTLWTYRPAKPKREAKPNGFARALAIVVRYGQDDHSEAACGTVMTANAPEPRSALLSLSTPKPRSRRDAAPSTLARSRRDSGSSTPLAPLKAKAARSTHACSSPEPTPAPAKAECGERRCPRCNHVGNIETDFGTRVMRGEVRPQSWCRACRRGASAPAPKPQLDLLAAH